MPLVIVAIGVILLLLLMIRFKMNGFIALVLVALAVGLMQGMPLDKVIGSIKAGVGGTLGSLALIMGFGAMLGKMLADCGGAQRIATTLIAKFGKKHIQWAVVLTGFTVGFALFYEVGFVLMLPLVFTIAASANIPLLYVGVPMAAALSVTHGFLPPHPGPDRARSAALWSGAWQFRTSGRRRRLCRPDRSRPGQWPVLPDTREAIRERGEIPSLVTSFRQQWSGKGRIRNPGPPWPR